MFSCVGIFVDFHKLVVLSVRWFYESLSRTQSDDMLSRIPYEGAFLVRQRVDQHNVDDPSQFAISFRYAKKPKMFLSMPRVYDNMCFNYLRGFTA